MGRGSEEDKERGHAILRKVKKMTVDASSGDQDKEFYFNRFVYQRLRKEELDNQKIRQLLYDKDNRCHSCKSKFDSIKGVVLHRLDDDKRYIKSNCVLVCKECHPKYHRGKNTSNKG
ncbi:MAG: HNH endonuclease [Nitrospirae bacterium]|nr:HNH endonuclease [Nitrospirota bacterium]MBI5097375.1 HNH endonuclease [Nitrospirota bacterium]